MDWAIKKLSHYGVEILNANSSGVIHSVYRNTVNLAFNGRILSLHPEGVPLSPIGLMTNIPASRFARLGIEKGNRVAVDPDAAILSSARSNKILLFYDQAAMADLRLPGPLPKERIPSLLQGLRDEMLAQRGSGLCTVFFSSGQTPDITAAALAQTMKASRLLGAGRWEAAASCLRRLIGLGLGLTPSGDDFLCGVLAGAEMAGWKEHPFARHLRAQLDAGLARTNDISRAFLRCALCGQYGEAIQLFYTQPAQIILSGMRQIGHSSGIDTLCGILYMLQIWTEFEDRPGV